MAAKKIEIGETGRTVALNVTVHRAMRGLSVAALAEKVRATGRDLTRQALSEIEAGRRRVDVDDLVTLALALEVSPAALLMPRADYPEEVVATSGGRAPARRVWRWLRAEAPIVEVGEDLDEAQGRQMEFIRRSQPAWEVYR